MAKGKILKNTEKEHKKQVNKGYFQTQIRENGPNFMGMKTAESIQRDANKIFNDFIFNSIDIESHYVYFEDPTFLSNLIKVADINAQYHYMTYLGLHQFLSQNSIQPIYGINVDAYVSVMYQHQKLSELYSLISQAMNSILSGNDARYVLHTLASMVQQKYFKNISFTNNTFVIAPPRPEPRIIERRPY